MNSLPSNLRLLCSRYSSIADVCRQIGLNRQQFNRYLNGESRPSSHNLSRIAEFFGISVSDLDLPSSTFAKHHGRVKRLYDAPFGFKPQGDEKLISRYCGGYYTYFLSPSFQGAIVRGFVRLYQDGDVTRSKVFDRYHWPKRSSAPSVFYRMNGVVTLNGGFLYILDRHVGLNASYTFTCLYPSYSERITMLNGLMIGVSTHLMRGPFASNLVYVAVDDQLPIRDVVRACGVYEQDSDTIPEEIRRIVCSRINGNFSAS